MYGVYVALCFPCRSLAASVATRPSTWSLASMTCHRLSILLALATTVRINTPLLRVTAREPRVPGTLLGASFLKPQTPIVWALLDQVKIGATFCRLCSRAVVRPGSTLQYRQRTVLVPHNPTRRSSPPTPGQRTLTQNLCRFDGRCATACSTRNSPGKLMCRRERRPPLTGPHVQC